MDRTMDIVKTICSFINPELAKKVFEDKEVVENDGFLEDLKKLNPNFNPKEYEDVLS